MGTPPEGDDMRAVTCGLLSGAMFCTVGCAQSDAPPPTGSIVACAPTQLDAPPPVPEVDPARSLKTAISHTAHVECGFERFAPKFQQCEEVVNSATTEELTAAYIDLARDPKTASVVVAVLARKSERLPFFGDLREAFRSRRDQVPSHRPDFFVYFARHGDISDLEWMEKAAAPLTDSLKRQADEDIKKLRKRLQAQGE